MNTGCVSRAPGEAPQRGAERRKSKRHPEGQAGEGAGRRGPGSTRKAGEGQRFVQTRPGGLGRGRSRVTHPAPQGEKRGVEAGNKATC